MEEEVILISNVTFLNEHHDIKPWMQELKKGTGTLSQESMACN